MDTRKEVVLLGLEMGVRQASRCYIGNDALARSVTYLTYELPLRPKATQARQATMIYERHLGGSGNLEAFLREGKYLTTWASNLIKQE
jgi:hypothetical protein